MKYLILGAGPSGLAIANQLLRNGETSFLVLEKESEPGGLCRSTMIEGSPFDTGGIHLVEDGNKISQDFLFSFLPEKEWNTSHWEGKIYIQNQFIDSPFESNIWELDMENQIRYLKDISQSGCNTNQKMPSDFKEWIYWKFGNGIAEDYMIPYNDKMFHGYLDQLGIYWLYKLPNVSFEDTLRSCLEKKAYGKLPGYGKKKFFYPKHYGFGEVWKRMGKALGEKLKCNTPVHSIDFDQRTVNHEYSADLIINTIPWTEFEEIQGMPEKLRCSIEQLKYTTVRVDFHKGQLNTNAAWVYFPESEIPYHRAMCRYIFCPGASGYGTESNVSFAPTTDAKYSFTNKYTYPVNLYNKEDIIKELLSWCKSKNVIGIGRWGEWRHHNSDVVVKSGIQLANQLCGKEKDTNK